MKQFWAILFSLAVTWCVGQVPKFDLVLRGGRVMDPETGLDAIRNVGINGNRITEITSDEIEGKIDVEVQGLVVAPGFIDLHVHGMTHEAHLYQVRDGVTTALELEGGMPFIRSWLEEKSGRSLVNYGASVSHGTLRALAMTEYQPYFKRAKEIISRDGRSSADLTRIMINLGKSDYQSLDSAGLRFLPSLVDEELSSGALGIGVPVGYYPGASQAEIYRIYEAASDRGVPIFSHTRGFGLPGIQEAIANATTSGASLHIVHANSLSLGDIQVTLDMVQSAQERGLDITTEVYPYTAASTSLESAIFDEGWQDKLGISFGDLQWEATGERLTEATFQERRKTGGTVIIHMMKPEWIDLGVVHPVTSIGSDGMPYAPGAHPRTAGTFSRVLGVYVREKGLLSLMQALEKMTIKPAQRLQSVCPAMYLKGRMQVGTDADITIFDPAKIKDKADFKSLQFSEGIQHVLVNGVFVVRDGKNVDNVFPGKPIVGKYRK